MRPLQVIPTTFSDFEYTGWQDLSCAYNENWAHVTNLFIPQILEQLPRLQDTCLIDIATGPGYAAQIAGRRGANVTGLDFSENMIAVARENVPDVDFRIADVENMPFEDSTVDYAISNFGFQHFTRPDLALKEISRVLKPGGKIVFTIWAEKVHNAAEYILNHAVETISVKHCSIPEGPNYNFLQNKTDLTEKFTNAGFDSASIATTLHVVPWHLEDPDELFRAELTASVRSGAILRQQSEDIRERIRATMKKKISDHYQRDNKFSIPVAAYVISANKL